MNQKRFADALAEADQSFAETGDGLEALGWVAFAAKAGLPLPTHIGKWLYAAINVYKSDKDKTLDAALQLDAVGPANPRLRMRNRVRMQGALAQMYVLWMGGENLDRAAAIVATTTKFAKKTLRSHFRTSRLGAEVRRANEQERVNQQRFAAAPALWNVWRATDTDE